MITIGIDPGLSGAIACLGHRGELLQVEDMPTMARGAGGAFVKRQVNATALAEILRTLANGYDRNEIQVLLEAVTALGGQGVASTFSFGLTAGIIEGVVAARGYRHELVRPQDWKRAFNLGPSKDQARAKAIRMYPSASLHRVKDHNRAEALLIARYGHDRKDRKSVV